MEKKILCQLRGYHKNMIIEIIEGVLNTFEDCLRLLKLFEGYSKSFD